RRAAHRQFKRDAMSPRWVSRVARRDPPCGLRQSAKRSFARRCPSLRETQLAMMNVLTARDGVAAALGDAPGLERLGASDARLDAVGRLEIYADMYRERLRAALAATFPLVAKHLGPEGFAEMAEGYFAVYPSRSPSLRDCGAGFGAFLASRRAGWLSDLA